jgi:hypothetical protein
VVVVQGVVVVVLVRLARLVRLVVAVVAAVVVAVVVLLVVQGEDCYEVRLGGEWMRQPVIQLDILRMRSM